MLISEILHDTYISLHDIDHLKLNDLIWWSNVDVIF